MKFVNGDAGFTCCAVQMEGVVDEAQIDRVPDGRGQKLSEP
jgi:hypothetical protein